MCDAASGAFAAAPAGRTLHSKGTVLPKVLLVMRLVQLLHVLEHEFGQNIIVPDGHGSGHVL
jgi:hypothetical protein